MKQKSKKTAKSIIAGVLLACMLMSGGLSTVGSYITQGIVASAADVTVVESGSCGAEGNNVVYTLDSEGTLIISGSGNMENYAWNGSPFYEDSNIKQVIIKDGVTSIGGSAFEDCTGLTSITIPDSVTSIGGWAFEYCTGLTSIMIPDSVTSIGYDAFYNTAWYNNQPNGLVYAGKVVYEYKGEMPENTSIQLKNGTVSISDFAFGYCSGLTSITIPDSVKSIGEDAFWGCTSLTSTTIPDSVKSIGETAFWGCTGLTSITIPDSVTSIGERSFYDCKYLKNVYYSGTKEEWNKIIIESGNDCLQNAKIHYNSTGEEDYQRKYTKAHVDYIDDTLMNRITNDWLGYCVSGKIMGMEDYQKIKNDYNKWRLATGDYFENPYDAVVGELIYSEGSSNAWDNLAKLSILKNERSIIKKLTQIIDFGGYDFTEEEFINNYSKYLKGDVLDSNVEKILERMFDDNEEDIKDALQDFDKLGKGIKYFEKGQKVIKAARNVIKYCSAVNAYYESEEGFKQLLIELADESLRAYNETSNIEYLLLYQSLSEFTTVETEQDIVDRVVQKAMEETITNIWDKIKDVTKEKINQWLMKKMAAKIGETAAANAGSFLLGCTIGKSVGIMFMNGVFHLSNASDEYIKAYYESQMAELFKNVLAKSADALKNNQTYEQAVQFHEALQMYKSMELSVIDTLLGWYDIVYDNEEREFAIALGYDPATGKIIGKPDEENLDPRYRLQICQLNWSYIRCPIDYDDSNNYYVVNPSDIPTNTSPVIMNICCPVNVMVKDSSDKTIVNIINDEIIEKSDNASVIIDHTAKSVMIMGKDDYSVIVEATDNGKMDYSITQLDSDCRIQSVVSYENIELENGTLYTGSVPENLRNPVEDCALKTDEGTVECTIRSADQNSYIPVDSIELNSEVLEMAVGEKKLLCAVIQPANATVQSVLWQSSDESIAEVDEYGNITALQEGDAVIYCIPENVSATKVCRVTIVPSRIKGDTNGDGTADIADALMIARYDAGLAELDETQLSVSDVNSDGSADIADALMIARYDAGLINSL